MINQRDLNELCTWHYRELPRRLTNSRTNDVLYTPQRQASVLGLLISKVGDTATQQ